MVDSEAEPEPLLQEVCYVTMRDEPGPPQSGWVRCGGRFLGLLSDKADVIWKD